MEQFAVKPVITFGTGALAALEELPGERVLVITDGFLAKSGLLDKVLAHLKGRTVEIFDQVVPDPPIDLVAKGPGPWRTSSPGRWWPSAAAPPWTAPRPC